MLRPVLSLILTVCCALPAMAQDRRPSHCIAIADAAPGLEYIQTASFRDPAAAGTVRLHYIDHAMFLLATPGGLSAITDYAGWVGNVDFTPTVVTMNHAHGTHFTRAPDPAIPHVLRGWGDSNGPADHHLDLGEMLVRNVPTDVRSRFGDGARVNGNSIFVFEAAGLCIGHLGHLHHVPDDAQFASIGRLDVVMVPVDGGYTMGVSDMAEVVKRLRSSVVIPMHWFSGASLEVFLDDMKGEFDVVETGLSELELSLRDLPGRPTILVLEPSFIN
jgi:L-ascorbate metabolism protein UlaG (beta-lactamase superfamily)